MKCYISRQWNHNPFLPSYVRRMAGYLVLSAPYTKYFLLTFYLCITCHALTHHFFVFNPPKLVSQWGRTPPQHPQNPNTFDTVCSQIFVHRSFGYKMSPIFLAFNKSHPSVVTMLMTSTAFPDFLSLYKFFVLTQFPILPLTLSENNLGSLQIESRY